MDLGLRGRKAIVTGGSKGIGKAIATLLVAEGADVAICARGKEAVDETVASLQEELVNEFELGKESRQAEVDKLAAEIEELKEEAEQYEAESEEQNDETDQLQERLGLLEEEVAERSLAQQEADKEIERLRTEVGMLTAQLEGLRDARGPAGER